MKAWHIALIFIVLVVWIMTSHRQDEGQKGFTPTQNVEVPFQCPVPGTC